MSDQSPAGNGPEQPHAPLKTVAQIRNHLRDEPEIWTQHDERNRWFCPHCGEIMPGIVIPLEGGMLLLQDLPYQMLGHLRACEAVRAGLPPIKFLADTKLGGIGITTELHRARLGQRHTLRPPPVVPGFEIDCLYRPMEAIGGDFYEFVTLPDGRVGIGIGDTSGHGVAACMTMAVTKKLLTLFARAGLGPKECLARVNRELYEDILAGMFITGLYAILDPKTLTLTYARAGQNPVIVYNPARDPKECHLTGMGLALGVDSGRQFDAALEEQVFQLQPGDLAVFYTDGITELCDANGKELGPEGLIQMLAKASDRPVHEMVRQVWFQAEKFFKSSGQPDDVTLVLLRVGARAGDAASAAGQFVG